jgi:formylglycine-generating enzyme
MDNSRNSIVNDKKSTPSVLKGKNYFLGIGINDYEKCRKLNNAVKDVEDIKALLLEKYDFEDENMHIVTDAAAQRHNILQILRGYIEKMEAHDNFIFYFSGHGELDKLTNEGHWIPFEAENGAWHQYISNAEIKTYLNAIPCRHLFLIVDSCFSGSVFQARNAKKVDFDRRETEPSRWALTAGRNELVDDGEAGTNSPFAKWLLTILKKNDKPLSVSTLCAQVKELVIPNSNQTPRGEPLNIKGHEGGEFIFHLSESDAQKEQRIWDKAVADNTEQSYTVYLSEYRKGRFAAEARQKLKDLAIEADYAKAKKIDKLYAYHDFLDKYDDEVHPRVADVEKRIKELENVEAKVSSPQPTPISPQYQAPKIETPTLIFPKKFDFEPDMVFVKGGTFKMGSNEFDDEKPIRDVTLSDFYMGKYPITQAQWRVIIGKTPSYFEGDSLPVEKVSWLDCQDFIKRINNKTGKQFRLPTEAEWEYAAKGGVHWRDNFTYAGSNTIDEVAWYNKNSEGKTQPVGTKKPNQIGIQDMSGNVYEWCSDWYGAYSPTTGSATVVNPIGAVEGSYRVIRGGCWFSGSAHCHSAYRNRTQPGSNNGYIGFRLVCPLQSIG